MTFFRKHQTSVIAFALVLGAGFLFFPVLFHGFINYDDTDYVTNNPHVISGWTQEGFLWAFTSRLHLHWHPLTWLSHMTDYQLFGDNPMGHHLTSLLLHLANTALVFLVLFRMTGEASKSAFVAAMLAVHPLHVETVAWTADRKDVLCGFFWLLGIKAYVWYVNRPNRIRMFFVTAAFILALMAKSMAVTLPLVLLILDYWPLKRFGRLPDKPNQRASSRICRFFKNPWVARIAEKGVLFLLLFSGAVAAIGVMRRELPSLETFTKLLPSSTHFSNAMLSYASYMGKLFWPAKLAVVYPYFTGIPVFHIVLSCLLIAGITILCFRLRTSFPYLPAGWLWYLITLLPVAGLISSGPHAPADRYTYLPLIGLFIMVAWGVPDLVSRFTRKKSAVFIPAAVCICVYAALASMQLAHWKNSTTLFTHAIHTNPYNWIAHNNLGNTLARQGDMDGAVFHYRRSLAVKPDNAKALNNLGAVLIKLEKYKEAASLLEDAVALKPGFFEARYNLGHAYARMEDYPNAAKHLERALKSRPDDAMLGSRLGLVYDRMGKRKKALALFNRVLKGHPDDYDAIYNTGVILNALGRYQKAAASLKKALKVRPDSTDARFLLAEVLFHKGDLAAAATHYRGVLKKDPNHLQAHMKLGGMAMAEGDLTGALTHYNAAVDIAPGFAGAHNNLGVTLARMGNVKQAVRHFEKAVELDSDFPGARQNLDRALGIAGHLP